MVSGSTVLHTAVLDYEAHLRHLYIDLAALYDGHAPHPMVPVAVLVRELDSNCVRIVPVSTCMVNERCEDLAVRSNALIVAEFPEEIVGELFDTVAGLLDLPFTVHAHTVREAGVEALRGDAELKRLFPRRALLPVDPATTHPELEEGGADSDDDENDAVGE